MVAFEVQVLPGCCVCYICLVPREEQAIGQF